MERWENEYSGFAQALLASLNTVLWPELGMQPIEMRDLVTSGQVMIRYVEAIAKVHPDKVRLTFLFGL
jgi:hypothetical protein